jgi:hypothetical protein
MAIRSLLGVASEPILPTAVHGLEETKHRFDRRHPAGITPTARWRRTLHTRWRGCVGISGHGTDARLVKASLCYRMSPTGASVVIKYRTEHRAAGNPFGGRRSLPQPGGSAPCPHWHQLSTRMHGR